MFEYVQHKPGGGVNCHQIVTPPYMSRGSGLVLLSLAMCFMLTDEISVDHISFLSKKRI